MMTIVKSGDVAPLELRLDRTKKGSAKGLTKIVLTGAFVLKWSWWHAKSYLPIVAVLMLSLGSLLVLQAHWLYRRLAHLPGIKPDREVLKDAG